MSNERRTGMLKPQRAMERDLNQDQLITLRELERFGWELKFVRRPAFQPSIPVVFDADRRRFAVLRLDGTLDENPAFEIRH